jgi:sec-independent protein translocase protein TatB
MEILGIGTSELVFIVIIALIVLGPKDMQKAGKTIGKWLRNVVTSDGWKMFQQTSRELRTLPNRLMREANDEVNKIGNEVNKTVSSATPKEAGDPIWMKNPNFPPRSQPVPTSPNPAKPSENKTAPPTEVTTPNEGDQQKDA